MYVASCILRVMCCSVWVCTGNFVMVPINLTCPHCLQHFFFEHLFHLYYETLKTNQTYKMINFKPHDHTTFVYRIILKH